MLSAAMGSVSCKEDVKLMSVGLTAAEDAVLFCRQI